MEAFFEEFEDYMYKQYGEQTYLKNMMESTLLPLKESLEGITSKDVMDKLFGTVDVDTQLGGPLKDLYHTLKDTNDKIKGMDGAGVETSTSKKIREVEESAKVSKKKEETFESGVGVSVNSISPEAIKSLQKGLDLKASDDDDKKQKDKVIMAGGQGKGMGFFQKLLIGGLLGAAGGAALLAGFYSEGEWKGTLKLIGTSLMKVLSKGVGKAVGSISKIPGVGTLIKNMTKSKGMFKFLGKSLKFLKKIPGIGTLISFAFAYSRFKAGEWGKGMMEIASGIATMFPGPGTAIAIGIDVLLALMDMSKGKEGGITATISGKAGEVWSKVKDLPKWMEENMGKIGKWIGESLTKGVMELMDWIETTTGNLTETVLKKVEESGGWESIISEGMVTLFDKIIPAVGSVLKGIFIDLPMGIGEGIWNTLDKDNKISDGIADFITGIGDSFFNLLQAVRNSIADKVGVIMDKLKLGGLKDKVLPAIRGKSLNQVKIEEKRAQQAIDNKRFDGMTALQKRAKILSEILTKYAVAVEEGDEKRVAGLARAAKVYDVQLLQLKQLNKIKEEEEKLKNIKSPETDAPKDERSKEEKYADLKEKLKKGKEERQELLKVTKEALEVQKKTAKTQEQAVEVQVGVGSAIANTVAAAGQGGQGGGQTNIYMPSVDNNLKRREGVRLFLRPEFQ